MPPSMPELAGAEHSFHDLPTGVRVHVAQAGPADAPPLLVLHGWPQHWCLWRDVIPRLARPLPADLPGQRAASAGAGRRPTATSASSALADDALALLDALGVERAGLVGHDWGGWAGWFSASTRRSASAGSSR